MRGGGAVVFECDCEHEFDAVHAVVLQEGPDVGVGVGCVLVQFEQNLSEAISYAAAEESSVFEDSDLDRGRVGWRNGYPVAWV